MLGNAAQDGAGIHACVHLKLEQFGSRLKIKWDNNNGIWRSNRNRKANIKLYYKDLTAISVSAGAKIEGTDMIRSSDFELSASSGGRVSIELKSNTVEVDVSSGGSASVSGSSERLVVEASSGGNFKGSDLEASEVRASASSGGNARVWATDMLRADASSGGNVKYRGNPSKRDISSSKWSGGSVRSM